MSVPFPTTRYDETANYTVLNVDVKPDLFVSNLNFFALEKYLNKRSTSCSFNPKAIHLILTEENEEIPENLSSHHAAKVVFVNAEELDGYCAMRKENQELLGSHSKSIRSKEGIELHTVVSKFENPSELIFCFGNVWPPYQNCALEGCSVNRGLLVDALGYFAEYLNVTLVLSRCAKSGCADYFENFLDYDCDIVLGFGVIDNGLMSTYPPWIDDFDYWFVPRPSSIPYWTYMFVALPKNIWGTWISITIFSSILKWSVDRILGRKSSFIHIFDIFILIFKIFLEQGANVFNNFISDMLFSGVLLSSIFILNLVYKTKFTYLLLGSNYYPSTINSVNDAASSNLYVTFGPHLRKTLDQYYPDMGPYFDSHFIYTDSSNWTNFLAYNKNTIALKSLLNSRYLGKLFLDDNGKSLINKLTLPLQKANYAFYFKRSHPQWSLFPYFINSLRDHGFLYFIESKYRYDNENGNQPEIASNFNLSLTHLEGPFMLWIVGNLIASLCFIVEIFCKQ